MMKLDIIIPCEGIFPDANSGMATICALIV